MGNSEPNPILVIAAGQQPGAEPLQWSLSGKHMTSALSSNTLNEGWTLLVATARAQAQEAGTYTVL